MLKKLKNLSAKTTLIIFLSTSFFIFSFALVKSQFSKEQTLYAKVKLSQGYWWANYTNPPLWYAKSLSKNKNSSNYPKNPNATLLSTTYYPKKTEKPEENQYNIYLTLKLKAEKNTRNNKYYFKRQPISVGSPIELQFPESEITGTIIFLSENHIKEDFVEKTITLTKKYVFPWEYQAIPKNATYNNGEQQVFQVISKKTIPTQTLDPDPYGNYSSQTILQTNYVSVKAKILLQKDGQYLLFGEEKVIAPGTSFNLKTPTYDFDNYTISSIE